MNDKNKLFYSGILVILMLIAGIACIINFDNWFKFYTIIKYASGCKDTYINNKLVQDNCSFERSLIESQKKLILNNQMLPDSNINLMNFANGTTNIT